MFITISNLFPRPDQPTRGLYNHYLFREMARIVSRQDGEGLHNICLVPEWRIWRWPVIRRWEYPARGNTPLPTLYLPVFYLPWVGRNWNDIFHSFAISRLLSRSEVHGLKAATHPTFYVPWLYPDGVAVARSIKGSHAHLWLMALGSDTFHLGSPLRRRKILEACSQAEGIVCVAQILADRLAAAGVPRTKLHVVPNGVDTALFAPKIDHRPSTIDHQPQTLDQNIGNARLTSNVDGRMAMISPPALSILFIGNLVSVKGPDVLLKAVAILKRLVDHRPQAIDYREESNVDGLMSLVSLTLIGDGPMRPQLELMARALGIGDRVQFLGRRPPDEVALWMNRATVLCLPSRSEGMPNVVLEARASGLPVVATPAGAVPELPLDKNHFLVVESCTPEALATGLHEMLDRDLHTRTPDPAIPTWSQMAEKILKLTGIMR